VVGPKGGGHRTVALPLNTPLLVASEASNLLGNENREVAVFLVDARAKSDKTHEEDAERKAPENQLPVAEVIHETACILQQLQQPQQTAATATQLKFSSSLLTHS